MTQHTRIGPRKAVWPLVVLAALLWALGGAGRVAAAADCQFVLGFQALHAMLPDTVGDCVENEQHHPGDGVTHQRTTNGLLVWQKATNHTAFTDGYHTWVVGPDGLRQRLNTERFDWEPAAPAPAMDDDALTRAFVQAGIDRYERDGLAATVAYYNDIKSVAGERALIILRGDDQTVLASAILWPTGGEQLVYRPRYPPGNAHLESNCGWILDQRYHPGQSRHGGAGTYQVLVYPTR